MNKSELKNLINEAIGEAMTESIPKNFPVKLKNKILKKYKNPRQAYAVIDSIAKKMEEGDQRISEMWMAYEEKGKNEGHESMGEDLLYVEYVSQMRDEEPFMMGGQKFEFVNAKYPNGKTDIGVYAFSGDVTYAYDAFRKMYNIKENHDETDMSNPEEKKEVGIAKKMKKHIDAFLKMHGQLDEVGAETDVSDPAEKKEIDHASEIKKLSAELLKMHGK
jgi:hypothetical protein